MTQVMQPDPTDANGQDEAGIRAISFPHCSSAHIRGVTVCQANFDRSQYYCFKNIAKCNLQSNYAEADMLACWQLPQKCMLLMPSLLLVYMYFDYSKTSLDIVQQSCILILTQQTVSRCQQGHGLPGEVRWSLQPRVEKVALRHVPKL